MPSIKVHMQEGMITKSLQDEGSPYGNVIVTCDLRGPRKRWRLSCTITLLSHFYLVCSWYSSSERAFTASPFLHLSLFHFPERTAAHFAALSLQFALAASCLSALPVPDSLFSSQQTGAPVIYSTDFAFPRSPLLLCLANHRQMMHLRPAGGPFDFIRGNVQSRRKGVRVRI